MTKNYTRERKKPVVKRVSYSICLFLLLCISGVITYYGGDNTWKEIFNICGLSNSTDTVAVNFDDGMYVHFLSVGKADCTYISCGDKNILIDAADKDIYNNVVEYLKSQNVKKLDLTVVSHPHRDHIGQMDKVIENFTIDKFLMSDIPEKSIPTSFTYKSMINTLYKKNIPVDIGKPGDKFLFGKMNIEILGPIRPSDELNNNSIVVKITYGNKKFLFMGDAQREEEEDILNSGLDVKADVLKVGHHGSLTSSTVRFLKAVSPEYSVISVGEDRNKLPKDKIIKRLNNIKSKILRTDLNGNIVFSTDGENLKLVTQKGE